MEKGSSNATLNVLYPLLEVLKINSREIFSVKMPRISEAQYQLCVLIENCTNEESFVVIPVVESIKNGPSKGKGIENKMKKEPVSLI